MIELKLIPINEKESEKNKFTTTLDKVDQLTVIAVNLKPLDAFTEVDGYTSALWEEIHSKKYSDKDIFTIYDKLIHATNGFKLLKASIELALIERDMRFNGITKSKINQYEKVQIEYLSLLKELEI